jgi:hypothetical protein
MQVYGLGDTSEQVEGKPFDISFFGPTVCLALPGCRCIARNPLHLALQLRAVELEPFRTPHKSVVRINVPSVHSAA